MRKFEIAVRCDARTTQVVEAPDVHSAMDYLKENLDGYGLKWEFDDMSCELDVAKTNKPDLFVGVREIEDFEHTDVDHVVPLDWLEDAGYKIVYVKQSHEEAQK